MTSEIEKPADVINDDISLVIQDLTHIVECVVKAFHALLDALLEQQASIIQGDAESISQSNDTVEQIMAETKRLEQQRKGTARRLCESLDIDEDAKLSHLLPHVEQRYAERLSELRDMLNALLQKIQSTNDHNTVLIEHSMRFVDNCLKSLAATQGSRGFYGRDGKSELTESSIYQGVV